jgi:hypothetical protein
MTVATKLRIEDGALIVNRVQDCEPILEANKALQKAGKQTGDFRHIGTVPCILIEKWMNEEGVPVLEMNKHEFAKFIRRKLDDPDWRFLRTDK